jgi:hypothetical protein
LLFFTWLKMCWKWKLMSLWRYVEEIEKRVIEFNFLVEDNVLIIYTSIEK